MIEDTVAFGLSRLVRRVRASVAVRLAEHGLHPGQEVLLAQLWEAEGLTQSQLAARLEVEPPTVTKMVQRLEAAGLVRRQQGNGRGRRVFLTEQGKQLHNAIESAWVEADRQLTHRLTSDQRDQLKVIMSQLTPNH